MASMARKIEMLSQQLRSLGIEPDSMSEDEEDGNEKEEEEEEWEDKDKRRGTDRRMEIPPHGHPPGLSWIEVELVRQGVNLDLNDLRAMHHRGELPDDALIRHAWMGTRTLASILKGKGALPASSKQQQQQGSGSASPPPEGAPRVATVRPQSAGPPGAGAYPAEVGEAQPSERFKSDQIGHKKPVKENQVARKTTTSVKNQSSSVGAAQPPSRLAKISGGTSVIGSKLGGTVEAMDRPVKALSSGQANKGAGPPPDGRRISANPLKRSQAGGAASPDPALAGTSGAAGREMPDQPRPAANGAPHTQRGVPSSSNSGIKRRPVPSGGPIMSDSDDEGDKDDDDKVFSRLHSAQDHKRWKKDREEDAPPRGASGSGRGGMAGGGHGQPDRPSSDRGCGERPKATTGIQAAAAGAGASVRPGKGTPGVGGGGGGSSKPPLPMPIPTQKGGAAAAATAPRPAAAPRPKDSSEGGESGTGALRNSWWGGNAAVARPQKGGNTPPAVSSVGLQKSTNSCSKTPPQKTSNKPPPGSQAARPSASMSRPPPSASMSRPPLPTKPGQTVPARPSVVSASKYKPPQQKASSSLPCRTAFDVLSLTPSRDSSAGPSSGFPSAEQPASSRPTTLYEAINQLPDHLLERYCLRDALVRKYTINFVDGNGEDQESSDVSPLDIQDFIDKKAMPLDALVDCPEEEWDNVVNARVFLDPHRVAIDRARDVLRRGPGALGQRQETHSSMPGGASALGVLWGGSGPPPAFGGGAGGRQRTSASARSTPLSPMHDAPPWSSPHETDNAVMAENIMAAIAPLLPALNALAASSAGAIAAPAASYPPGGVGVVTSAGQKQHQQSLAIGQLHHELIGSRKQQAAASAVVSGGKFVMLREEDRNLLEENLTSLLGFAIARNSLHSRTEEVHVEPGDPSVGGKEEIELSMKLLGADLAKEEEAANMVFLVKRAEEYAAVAPYTPDRCMDETGEKRSTMALDNGEAAGEVDVLDDFDDADLYGED